MVAVAIALWGCASQQSTSVQSSQHRRPPAPSQPAINGNFQSVSAADVRSALKAMRTHMIKQYGSALPVYNVYIVSRNRMTMHYWASGLETYGYVDRINGKWKFTEVFAERAIITGASNPTQ